MLRREQRAAILIGNDRDRKRPERSAWAVISSLSIPTSGRSTSIVVAPAIVVRLSSVCDATWPIDFAGDQRLGAPAARQPLGDSHHQPAIHHDAKLGSDGQQHLLLDFAERHEHQPRALLVRRQERRDLADFLLRRARQNRIAVEMNQTARSSRGASGGTRRPANRCRPRADTPRARPFPSADRRRRVLCRRSRRRGRTCMSTWIVSSGLPRSTRQPFTSLIRPPTSRSICGDVSGNRLSARRADTRNDAG